MKTPKRKLTFQTIGETPAKRSVEKKCVLVHYPAGKWVPALIEQNVSRDQVRVMLFSESHTVVKVSDVKLFLLHKDTKLRVRDDERTYRVVGTSSSPDKTPWRLESGENIVSLHAGRSTKTLKTQVRNVFLYDAGHLPSYAPNEPPLKKSKKQSQPKVAQQLARPSIRSSSIYYEPQAQLRTSQIFDGCCFIVDGDLTGQKARILAEKGGTIVTCEALQDHKLLKEHTFFAVIGPSITPSSPYLEALAIGWPCLGPAFIDDCIQNHSYGNWKLFLHAIIYDGIVKSQNVALFEHQWTKGYNLYQQFNSRTVFLAVITVPMFVGSHLPPLLRQLVALARPHVETIQSIDEVPPGCLFICDTTKNYGEITKQQLCRQPRLDCTVELSAEWVLKSVMNQCII